MHSFELTDRGKITVAILVVIPILILSIILAIFALAADPQDEPPAEPVANESRGTVTHPGQTETPQPPDSGGFPPPSDDNDPDTPTPDGTISDDTTSDDTAPDEDSPLNGNADTQDSPTPPLSNPSLNLSTGQLSFFFFPHDQISLDRETSTLLNTFLNLPSNTPNSIIAIETPVLSADYSDQLMSIMTSVLGERNISPQQITHMVNPEMPQEEHFEVVMYFIISQEVK